MMLRFFLYICLLACLHPDLITAINSPAYRDTFFYPPLVSKSSSWNLTFNDGDTLELYYSSSVGSFSLGLLCCDPSVCHVKYRHDNITGDESGVFKGGFHLRFGAIDDCYMRLDQPLRGNEEGVESSHFNIAPSQGIATYRSYYGNTTMPNSQTSGNSNEGSGQGGGGGGSSTTDMMQGNSSQFSQTNPDVQLDTDGDATQFSDDCLDLNRQIGSCWANLNMAAWIRLWVARNTPCAAIANCTMVAPGFTTWTTHFIEATASINSQCYSLQSTYCNPETYRDPGDAGGDRTKQLLYARYAYGAWTIRSIFNFFHSWSVATDKALNSAVTQIPLMTQVSFVDVKDKHNWYADVIATGITLGVALIPGAEPAAPFMYLLVNQGIKAIGGALPAASKELWPKKPSVDDQIMLSSDQLASLIDAPGDTGVRSIFQNNLDVTLRAIQGAEAVNSVATNDVDAFLNATDSGRFSDNATVLQLNANNAGQLAVISSTMNTYLLTTLLKQNGYRPILLPGVNPAAVYQSTNNCPEWAGSDCSDDTNDLGCKGELDAYGMCKNVWFSKAFNSSFILLKDDGTKLDQTIDVLHAIVDNGLLANRGDVATAFRYIFEYPAICSLRNVFPPNANPYYSDDNGGGFYYLIDAWPEAAKSSLTISNIVSFLPIAPLSGVVGHGFVDLRIDPKYAPKLIRPNNTVYSLNPSNVTDTYCISQFSVDIATFWAGAKAFDWGKNAPEPM